MTQAKRYYRPDEVWHMLAISKRTFYRRVARGQIKAKKIDGAIRIAPEEFCRLCPSHNALPCRICLHLAQDFK